MALKDYINNKPTIKTDRLIIRPMIPSDVDALREWMPDKSIYKFWGKAPGRTEKNPELLFEKELKPTKSFHLGIAEKLNDKVIGDGTESLSAMTRFCFENTELKRLWTEVDIRNTASCRILEKCGYVKEGLIRQGRMVNSWCDYYIYGILDSDFESL